MKEVLEVIRLVNRKTLDLTQTGLVEFLDFWDKEFLFNVGKYLIINRTFKNQIALDFSNATLVECLKYYLANQHKHQLKLVEMVKYLLDPARGYYKINDQDPSNSMLPTLVNHQALNHQHQTFISTLVPGQKIDCVKTDYAYKKSRWTQATVLKIKN